MIKIFTLTAFTLAIFSSIGRSQSFESFSNFENVTQTFYHSSTGRPYLEFFYSKIEKEYKKLKFLKFGLPTFVVHGLNIQFDLASYNHVQVLKKLSDFEKKSALRFVLARDSKLKFILPNNEFLELDAKILKSGKLGNFSTQDTKIKTAKGIQSYKFLDLTFQMGNPGYKLIQKSENSSLLTMLYGVSSSD